MLLRCLTLSACLVLQGCRTIGDRPRLIHVKMSIGRSAAFLPVFLANRLGFYEKHGLTVTIDDGPPSTTKTTQALLGGSVDIAGGLFEQTLLTASQGQVIT